MAQWLPDSMYCSYRQPGFSSQYWRRLADSRRLVLTRLKEYNIFWIWCAPALTDGHILTPIYIQLKINQIFSKVSTFIYTNNKFVEKDIVNISYSC